ncbi:MAG TPA: glycosyltransferase [Gemmatimonadota bacterium]|jgi:GT2 family glycosyltransferase
MAELTGVTVVIPSYGREEVLVETVRRVLGLEPPPDEILVMDQTPSHGAEVEDELARLEGAGAIRWIRLGRASIPHAMNAGLLRARSDIVLFLDDDVVPDRRLVRAHREAHRDSGASVIAGQVLQPGEEPVSDASGPFRFSSAEPRRVTEVMGGNFSIRRDLALAIGGMDENFVRAAYGFEAELCERARSSGATILFEPRATLRHLRAPTGGTRAWGDHLRTIRPGHSVGAFYRIFRTDPLAAVPLRVAGRIARSVRTRHHLSRPWWIPVTLVAESLGLIWAVGLALRGPRLLAGEVRGAGRGEGAA